MIQPEVVALSQAVMGQGLLLVGFQATGHGTGTFDDLALDTYILTSAKSLAQCSDLGDVCATGTVANPANGIGVWEIACWHLEFFSSVPALSFYSPTPPIPAGKQPSALLHND